MLRVLNIILQLGEGSKFFNKHRCANFSGQKKDSEAFWDVYFFENIMHKKKKNFESNLILESENLSLLGRVQREN